MVETNRTPDLGDSQGRDVAPVRPPDLADGAVIEGPLRPGLDAKTRFKHGAPVKPSDGRYDATYWREASRSRWGQNPEVIAGALALAGASPTDLFDGDQMDAMVAEFLDREVTH